MVLYLVARLRAHRVWLLLLLPFAVLLVRSPGGRSAATREPSPPCSRWPRSPGSSGARLAPGPSRRTRRESEEYLAGSLLEHVARGERARIARELHDVVAHHISMIAIQAETARLTTPGMPPEGSQAARRHRRHRPRRAHRDAPAARRAARGRRDARSARTPTGPRRPGRPGRRARATPAVPSTRLIVSGHGDPARAGRRADGLPDRPGGADQRAAARARRGGRRRARLRRRRAPRPRPRQRARALSPRRRGHRRARPARHARAGSRWWVAADQGRVRHGGLRRRGDPAARSRRTT